MNDPRFDRPYEPKHGQCLATFYDKDENEFQIPVTYSYTVHEGNYHVVREYDTNQLAWDRLIAENQTEYFDETVKEAIREHLGVKWGNIEFPHVRHRATIVETQNLN